MLCNSRSSDDGISISYNYSSESLTNTLSSTTPEASSFRTPINMATLPFSYRSPTTKYIMDFFFLCQYLGPTPKEPDLIGLGWGCPSDLNVQPRLRPLPNTWYTVPYLLCFSTILLKLHCPYKPPRDLLKMQILQMHIFADKCFSKSKTGTKILPFEQASWYQWYESHFEKQKSRDPHSNWGPSLLLKSLSLSSLTVTLYSKQFLTNPQPFPKSYGYFEFTPCLCFLIRITHDIISWVYKTNEHMTLAFLSSILASSTSGYSFLFLLEERFWPRSLLLWGFLGVLEGKRLEPALVPLPIQHTPESQHFTHKPLCYQSPALPGTLRFQENEK